MKNNILKKLLTVSLTAVLVLPISSNAQTNTVKGNSPDLDIISQLYLKEQLEDAEINFEDNNNYEAERIEESDLELDKEDVTFLGDFTKERISISEVHDSVEGYLKATEDAHIYGLQIQPGVLLQAQMEQPSMESLDYDLYILDSTKSQILDGSENYTYFNSNGKTCPEGVGIINTSDSYQTYYIMVRSSAGGSGLKPYTLRYSVSYPYDANETDENVRSAKQFNLTSGGFLLATRNISSPVDADWYKVIVPSSKAYDQVTISLTNTKNKLELYKDATGYNTMFLMESIQGGKSFTKALGAGTYYIRVSYEGADSDFDSDNVNNYTMTLLPILKATDIVITKYESEGPNVGYVSYPYGYYFRAQNYVTFNGLVYSKDPVTGDAFAIPSTTVEIDMISIVDKKFDDEGNIVPVEVKRTGLTNTNNKGEFRHSLSFLPSVGLNTYENYATISYYDLVIVNARVVSQPSISFADCIYHLAHISYK